MNQKREGKKIGSFPGNVHLRKRNHKNSSILYCQELSVLLTPEDAYVLHYLIEKYID